MKENDFPSFVQNYEFLLRNEELRYVASTHSSSIKMFYNFRLLI